MCEKTNPNVERIKQIRENIANKTIEFVKNPNNNNKILLVKPHQGTGKTITVLKTLLSAEDILFVYLSYEHEHLKGTLENEVLKDFYLFHLKGRSQEYGGDLLCTNPLYGVLKSYHINIKSFLCNPKRCEDFEDCEYLEQFRELKEDLQSWAGVHSHLNIKFTDEYLGRGKKKFPYRCLVIDENPVSSLISKVEITESDLIKNLEAIKETFDNINEEEDSKWEQMASKIAYPILLAIIKAFRLVLDETTKEGITGIEFVNKFLDKIEEGGDSAEEIKKGISDDSMDLFIKLYKDTLYNRFSSGYGDEYLKDVLEDIIDIAMRCFSYSINKPETEINLPFYSEQEESIINGKNWNRKYIVKNKVNKKLPDVPTIILDATGEKDFYEQIFNREVIEYVPSIEIERNVIQITNGMYYAKSLFVRNTRNNVYNAVRTIILHHQKKGDGKINVVTLKKFATIEDEKGKYERMSIERYLSKTRVDMSNVQIRHYGDVKGKNVMQDDRVLVLVGTPEPNIHSFPKEVGCWYEGENKIVTDRFTEPEGSKYHKHDYRYKDPRYFTWVKHKREHELEQDIERLRFALSIEEKVVYLFSMLPIDFETKEITIPLLHLELLQENERRCIPHIIVLNALFEGRGKVGHKTLGDKTRNKKEVKKVGFPKIVKELLDVGVIKYAEGRGTRHRKTGRVYQFTDSGKEWYEYTKKTLADYFESN